MKAISIRQPFATLIALGHKTYETRRWSTHYRGPLAIHASGRLDAADRLMCLTQPFRDLLVKAGYVQLEDLPKGAIVAIAEMTDCSPTVHTPDSQLSEIDRLSGDWTSIGKYAFKLENVRAVQPVPMRGGLSMFTVPDDGYHPEPEK